MSEVVELQKDVKTNCSGCNGEMIVKSCIVKDTKPYKIITSMSCDKCDLLETTEEDFTKLDYGIKITAKFNENNFEEGIKRIVFTNTNAETYFYDNHGKLMFSFNSGRANVDCLEGLIMRGKDALLLDDSEVNVLNNYFQDIFKSHEFFIVIEDLTGYSKICPPGYEYTTIMDYPIEKINEMDPEVLHEKISKD